MSHAGQGLTRQNGDTTPWPLPSHNGGISTEERFAAPEGKSRHRRKVDDRQRPSISDALLTDESDFETERNQLPDDQRETTSYHEAQGFKSEEVMPSMEERERKQSPIIAELKTNIMIKDESSVVKQLSFLLAAQFSHYSPVVVVELDHGICLAMGDSFAPCYTLSLTTSLSRMANPGDNNSDTTFIQTFVSNVLGVPQHRGILFFRQMENCGPAMARHSIRSEKHLPKHEGNRNRRRSPTATSKRVAHARLASLARLNGARTSTHPPQSQEALVNGSDYLPYDTDILSRPDMRADTGSTVPVAYTRKTETSRAKSAHAVAAAEPTTDLTTGPDRVTRHQEVSIDQLRASSGYPTNAAVDGPLETAHQGQHQSTLSLAPEPQVWQDDEPKLTAALSTDQPVTKSEKVRTTSTFINGSISTIEHGGRPDIAPGQVLQAPPEPETKTPSQKLGKRKSFVKAFKLAAEAG